MRARALLGLSIFAFGIFGLTLIRGVGIGAAVAVAAVAGLIVAIGVR